MKVRQTTYISEAWLKQIWGEYEVFSDPGFLFDPLMTLQRPPLFPALLDFYSCVTVLLFTFS